MKKITCIFVSAFMTICCFALPCSAKVTYPSVVGTWSVTGTEIVRVIGYGGVKPVKITVDDSLTFYDDHRFVDGNIFISGPLDTWSQKNYNYAAIIDTYEIENYFGDYLAAARLYPINIDVIAMSYKGSINKNGSAIKGKIGQADLTGQ